MLRYFFLPVWTVPLKCPWPPWHEHLCRRLLRSSWPETGNEAVPGEMWTCRRIRPPQRQMLRTRARLTFGWQGLSPCKTNLAKIGSSLKALQLTARGLLTLTRCACDDWQRPGSERAIFRNRQPSDDDYQQRWNHHANPHLKRQARYPVKISFLSISALPAKWRLSRERCYSLQSSDTAWRWPHHQIALDKRNLRLGTRHTPLPSATRTCQFPFSSSLFLWMSLKFKRLTRRCSRPTAPDQLPLTFDPLFCPSNDRTL